MTIHTSPHPLQSTAATSGSQADRARFRSAGHTSFFSGCRTLVATIVCKVCALFTASKDRHVPVIHEKVVLSEEGAKIWEEVSNPASPVGKVVGHRRSRVADGDPPR
jgi:hypothetical protein